jgi:hypothetical protein
MANILILMKFHVHDGYHLIPIGLMLAAYFVFLYGESASGDFQDLAYIFSNIFDQWLTWLTLAFCTFYIVVQETVYNNVSLIDLKLIHFTCLVKNLASIFQVSSEVKHP